MKLICPKCKTRVSKLGPAFIQVGKRRKLICVVCSPDGQKAFKLLTRTMGMDENDAKRLLYKAAERR